MFKIRQATIDDAELLSVFINRLDSESKYLLYDQHERKNNFVTTKNYLTKMNALTKNIVVLAENTREGIVGFACGETLCLRKMAHVMKSNLGVLRAYQGKGLGRILLQKLIVHAEQNEIIRIEANIVKENKLSLNLCKKFGFTVEGMKQKSIKIENFYHDEYLVAKLLVSTSETL